MFWPEWLQEGFRWLEPEGHEYHQIQPPLVLLPSQTLLRSTEQHGPSARTVPGWGGTAPLICCCCIYPPALGISCSTGASPTCSKPFGFYPAWQDLDRHSLDGGSTKPLSPGCGRALWKIPENSLPIISRGGYFPCQPFQSILWLAAFLIALKGFEGGGWRRAVKYQWAIGRGGAGRTMWPRMVGALGICPEQENKETANNDREGLMGTCFTLWHATSSF